VLGAFEVWFTGARGFVRALAVGCFLALMSPVDFAPSVVGKGETKANGHIGDGDGAWKVNGWLSDELGV
jgi:hypothetical protein